MLGFFHYLLKLLSGHKQWHVLVLVVLSVQLIVAAWFLQQQRLQDAQHIEQLFEFNTLSATMANHAVAVSQLELSEFDKLAPSVEHYQQKLDVLRPMYRQGVSASCQTFRQLNDTWL